MTPILPHLPSLGEGTGRLPPAGGEAGRGATRLPPFPARGRVGEGAALTQGDGETGLPHPPCGGRGWKGAALPGSGFIPLVCGVATWTAKEECA